MRRKDIRAVGAQILCIANKYTNDWTIKLGQSHEHQIRIQRNPITELLRLILLEHTHTDKEIDKKKKLFNEMNFAKVLALQSVFNFERSRNESKHVCKSNRPPNE